MADREIRIGLDRAARGDVLTSLALRGARSVSRDRIGTHTLYVEQGRIVRGPARVPDVVIDLEGYLLFPGLVNAHDHLWLNAIRPPAPAATHANSYEWIESFQPAFGDPAVRGALDVDKATRAWHGGLKNLLAGVTTVAHHDQWHPVMADAAFPVRVLERYRWSHSLRLAGRYGPPIPKRATIAADAMPWFIHLAEGTDEEAAGELDALETLGALGPDTVAIHAVALGPPQQQRLIASGAGVVWCPASNLRMLGRTLEPSRFIAAGRLGLGTDSRLTGSPDLLDEMRVAADAGRIGGRTLFRLVTDRPAGLMRLPDVGHLDEGAHADVIVLRDDGGDPFDALLAATRADIRAVLRGGRPVLADEAFAYWFAAMDAPCLRARLDGRPTLCAPDLVQRPRAVVLEEGFALCR